MNKTELNKNEVAKKVSEKKGDDSFVDMVSDDKLKGIYDKATNSSGVSFASSLDVPSLGADTNLLNNNLPNVFADNTPDNTQPFESFSEYRNRIKNLNNISEDVEKKEIKIKPKKDSQRVK